MSVIKIPKDLNDIKEKFIFGLTKRQIICFGGGLALGLPTYFLCKSVIGLGLTGSLTAMCIVAAPLIFAGIYKKHGITFEKSVKFMFDFLRKPKKRYYRTTNFYRCMENQMEYTRLQNVLQRAEQSRKGGAGNGKEPSQKANPKASRAK